MPRWFWYFLWGSQVVNWFVTIWAYGTPDGSCLLAPAFTIAYVLKNEIVEDFKVLFGDEYTFEDEYEDVGIEEDYTYYQIRKGA